MQEKPVMLPASALKQMYDDAWSKDEDFQACLKKLEKLAVAAAMEGMVRVQCNWEIREFDDVDSISA